MRRAAKAPEPGYQNQSAATPAEPRREHIQEPVFGSLEETVFWRNRVADRQPGEDVVAWLERSKLERERIDLGPAAPLPPPPQPSSAQRQARMEFGPGADDDSV